MIFNFFIPVITMAVLIICECLCFNTSQSILDFRDKILTRWCILLTGADKEFIYAKTAFIKKNIKNTNK